MIETKKSSMSRIRFFKRQRPLSAKTSLCVWNSSKDLFNNLGNSTVANKSRSKHVFFEMTEDSETWLIKYCQENFSNLDWKSLQTTKVIFWIYILFYHKVSTIYRTVEWQTNSAVRTIQRLQENIER